MTPLAHQIVREMMLPQHRRTIEDRSGLLKRMDDIHCFEITDVLALSLQTVGSIVRCGGMDATLAFLPAPKTWIEWQSPAGFRVGYLLDGTRNEQAPVTWAAMQVPGHPVVTLSYSERLPLLQNEDGRITLTDTTLGVWAEKTRWSSVGLCVGAIPIINTPRIIGRRQHMPHRGLEKRLLKDRPNIGHFPLHAWTEILLRVEPPKDASDEEHEARLTGQRALHFCRAHLRIRCGRLEVVRAHWRGDASLGVKRSRYRLSA